MTQNYKNHRRFQPLQHFVVLPILLFNLGLTVQRWWATPSFDTGWTVLVALALFGTAISARLMSLTIQDRIIRLEMHLRLMRVLPAALAARIGELRARHLVGLRFAGDAELPALVQRCLSGELRTSNDVKKQITDWQADLLRA